MQTQILALGHDQKDTRIRQIDKGRRHARYITEEWYCEDKLATMELDEIIEKLISLYTSNWIKLHIQLSSGLRKKTLIAARRKAKHPKTLMPSITSLTFENIETGHAKSIEDILAFDQGKHLVSCSMDKKHICGRAIRQQHTNFAIRSKKSCLGTQTSLCQ